MRGSIKWQVSEIFHKSGIKSIGESKHASKEIARYGGAKSWHEMGKMMGIHSHATAHAYTDVWRQVLNYSKSELKIKDIEKLTGEAVGYFLSNKIEKRIAKATFLQYAAACEKLEVALIKYAEFRKSSNSYNFSDSIANARAEAKAEGLREFEGSRAYQNPQKTIQSIENADHKTMAGAQLESGMRLNEMLNLKLNDFKGIRPDKITSQLKGQISVKGKGGKIRTVQVSEKIYDNLRSVVRSGSMSGKNIRNQYRASLKAASEKAGQDYSGSHGLRWNFAQSRFSEVQQSGMSYEQALGRVSQEMGHERGDITEHYLK